MGLILQCQRRAIDRLREYATPLPKIADGTNLFLNDGIEICRLHIAGVSGGFGTCSDIFGMDVLVLDFWTPPEGFKPRIPHGSSVAKCAYAVIARPTTREELARLTNKAQAMSVELVLPAWVKDDEIIFYWTGITAHYAPI